MNEVDKIEKKLRARLLKGAAVANFNETDIGKLFVQFLNGKIAGLTNKLVTDESLNDNHNEFIAVRAELKAYVAIGDMLAATRNQAEAAAKTIKAQGKDPAEVVGGTPSTES